MEKIRKNNLGKMYAFEHFEKNKNPVSVECREYRDAYSGVFHAHDFVGGIRGLDALSARVDDGSMAVAFSMYPTTMDDLMDIADAGAIMPPKSTWFEPKLRSGLFIHKLSDGNFKRIK